MARGNFSFPGRVGYWLIFLVVTLAMVGCAPKIPEAMSTEDLQQCDDTTETIKTQIALSASPYEQKYVPHMVTPPPATINAPLTGVVLPFGEVVKIKFNQPAPDPNVSSRVLKVYVSPINSVSLTEVLHPLFSFYGGGVPADFQAFEYSWTPGSSGKFIVMVLLRNLRNGGDPKGLPRIDYGPPSMAYVCVKIKPPQAGDMQTVAPGDVNPVQDITLPTITRTVTITPTSTFTLTFTPTLTETLTPTFIPPVIITPTFTLTATTSTSCNSIKDKAICESNNKCKWDQPVIGGPGSCIKK